MERLICKECGKEFIYNKMSSCKAQLKSHLRIEHNMQLVDYIVKHEYGGIHPICPCGCGNKLNLKNSGNRWIFNTYYSDACFGRLVKFGNGPIVEKLEKIKKRDFDIVKYYETHYDRKTYEEAFEMFKSKQFSLSDVSNSYKIDKRTLKKVWLAMKITTPVELTELTDYTKYKLSSINYPTACINRDSMLSWMYNMAKAHPGKYTINSVITEYNKSNRDNPCKESYGTILKSLHRIYGDEIDMIFSLGYHSKEEYDFFLVLKYYFSKHCCRMGKRFIIDDGKYVYFDYMIDSKILIEYDSVGTFHENKEEIENDQKKEKFAKDNGYVFLRLSLDDTKDINTLSKIKKLIENEVN